MKDIESLLSESANSFVHRGSALSKLLTKASLRKQWTAQLRAVIDNKLRHQVEVSDIKGEILIVLCQTAAAATKTRFQSQEIIDQLSVVADFRGVTKLSVKVSSG